MREISENRATREIFRALKNPTAFTEEQMAHINKVYESKTRNKDYVERLHVDKGVYVFAFYAKKNRHLCCPKTEFEFFPNGYCVMHKDSVQGDDVTRKYYEF